MSTKHYPLCIWQAPWKTNTERVQKKVGRILKNVKMPSIPVAMSKVTETWHMTTWSLISSTPTWTQIFILQSQQQRTPSSCPELHALRPKICILWRRPIVKSLLATETNVHFRNFSWLRHLPVPCPIVSSFVFVLDLIILELIRLCSWLDRPWVNERNYQATGAQGVGGKEPTGGTRCVITPCYYLY